MTTAYSVRVHSAVNISLEIGRIMTLLLRFTALYLYLDITKWSHENVFKPNKLSVKTKNKNLLFVCFQMPQSSITYLSLEVLSHVEVKQYFHLRQGRVVRAD